MYANKLFKIGIFFLFFICYVCFGSSAQLRLIICIKNVQRLSPENLMMKTSEIKKEIDDTFQKVNVELHPSMVPFLTALELSHEKTTLKPYIAPVNHNEVNESKTLQIIHTFMGNFCHGDKNKESRPEDMGNDACISLLIMLKLVIFFFNKIF
jgi:hypothetical protein